MPPITVSTCDAGGSLWCFLEKGLHCSGGFIQVLDVVKRPVILAMGWPKVPPFLPLKAMHRINRTPAL